MMTKKQEEENNNDKREEEEKKDEGRSRKRRRLQEEKHLSPPSISPHLAPWGCAGTRSCCRAAVRRRRGWGPAAAATAPPGQGCSPRWTCHTAPWSSWAGCCTPPAVPSRWLAVSVHHVGYRNYRRAAHTDLNSSNRCLSLWAIASRKVYLVVCLTWTIVSSFLPLFIPSTLKKGPSSGLLGLKKISAVSYLCSSIPPSRKA